MSLVELMVSIGILSIVTFGVITLFTTQGREVRALQESLAKLDLEPTIIKALSNGGICTYILADPSQASTAVPPNRSQDVIDTSTPASLAATEVSVQKIPASISVSAGSFAQVGGLASANSNSVKIASMKFKNFRNNGIDQYLADFEVAFDPPPATIRPLAPIVIKNLSIASKATDPANAKSFVDCSSPRGPAPELHRYTFTTATPGTTQTISWVVPSGVTSALVSMAGGGGSGFGWRVSNVARSGDSGGYVNSYPVHLVPGETISITIGKGAEAHAPVKTGTLAAPGPPYYVYTSPPADDGLGGYPGDASKITSPTLGTILECAGGSGAASGGIDNYSGNLVAGNLAGATYGSGNPPLPAPNRPAAGVYAQGNGPGTCGGSSPAPQFGVGNNGQQFYSATGLLNSGFWAGGRTPMGYGSGGDIGVSGCYVTTTVIGTCIFPSPGRDGIVIIDVLY